MIISYLPWLDILNKDEDFSCQEQSHNLYSNDNNKRYLTEKMEGGFEEREGEGERQKKEHNGE